MGSAGRIKWLDSCKGFAIILVVLGHMNRGIMSANMFLQDTNALKTLDRAVYSFHMPLFWMLAGYTFYLAYCKKREQSVHKFKKQLINTAYVYFLFSTVQWVIQFIASDYTNTKVTVSDLLLMPVRPMSPFWFTFVLFFYYIFFYFFIKLSIPEYVKIGIVAIVSALGNPLDFDIVIPVRILLLHMLFFYLGIVFARYGRMIADSKIAFALLTVVGAALLAAYVFFSIPYIPLLTDVLLPSVLGLAFFNLFYKVSALGSSRFFCFIGSYSLEIYVTHCILTSAMRSALKMIGINSSIAMLVIGTVVGTALPIIWAMVIKKVRIYDLFFRPAELFSKKAK